MVSISRRWMMQGGLAVSAGLLARGARAADLPLTPRETTGPFYPQPWPGDGQANMLQQPGGPKAAGIPIEVQLRVVDPAGRPVPSAILMLWQANAAGRYAHGSDTSRAPLDPVFRGSALARADKDGQLRLVSVRPGPYLTPDGRQRTPHLHVEAAGTRSQLVTQMFFASDPLNAKDTLIQRMAARSENPALLAAEATRPTVEGMAQAWAWTLVLPKG